MKKALAALVMIGICFAVTGCVSRTAVNTTHPQQREKLNTRIFDSGINKVWDAAIQSIGESFFVLDNIEKDSHIVTLSFSLDDPEAYIDCGTITFTVSGGMSGNGTYSFPLARKHATFNVGTGGPAAPPAIRNAKIEGKANILFSEEGKNKTKVAVNTRYVFIASDSYQRWTPVGFDGVYQLVNASETITFNTGQTGKNNEGNVSCVTLYTLEQYILDEISKKLGAK